MAYAEVAVDAPGGHRHTFTYSVPVSFEIAVGFAVRVPFGPRVLQGIVTRLTEQPSVSETREISSLIADFPLISAERIQLALWMADYYLSPVFSSMSVMLPPGFEGAREVKARRITYLRLSPKIVSLHDVIEGLRLVRAVRQADLLECLSQSGGRLTESHVRRGLNFGANVVNGLVSKGLIEEENVGVSRDPLASREFPLEFPFSFTDDQQLAWNVIESSIAGGADGGPTVFLLNGVTGSGKTEIYLQALAETVRRGKKGICLVPEISLTPQMIDRFVSRFPGRVAVLHSKMSLGEQFDVWHGIRRGNFDIVIGPRSAVFAPQPDLGLIIVDEEHEWAYKQSDKMPRYHARDVAVQLGKLAKATVILGSATPSIESFYKSRNSEYRLVELKERVTPLGSTPLPRVDIVNMRNEFKSGHRGMFSRLLESQIAGALERHEQAILFINRRGLATFLECMNCGYIPSCKRCSSALTYHSSGDRLICHHCRRVYPIVRRCPRCSSEDIKHFGIGTEAVEAECRRLFPRARTIRFDSDSVTRTREYENIVNSFRRHESDILVGTQIIAKGLNFPEVSLVGVVNADTGLNLPDFRAGERTFQLLCQVAGRAGRGSFAGKAVIQTFSPGYYAIKFAARHDYVGFYESEIRYRTDFGYPPLRDMIRLVYSNTNEEKCRREAERMARSLNEAIDSRGLSDAKLIGPAPGYMSRLRGKFQMQVIFLGHDLQNILSKIDIPRGWILDVDPVGMI
jgi:primosomal protein N' (replication factor Y) (superfamily II helicase)